MKYKKRFDRLIGRIKSWERTINSFTDKVWASKAFKKPGSMKK